MVTSQKLWTGHCGYFWSMSKRRNSGRALVVGGRQQQRRPAQRMLTEQEDVKSPHALVQFRQRFGVQFTKGMAVAAHSQTNRGRGALPSAVSSFIMMSHLEWVVSIEWRTFGCCANRIIFIRPARTMVPKGSSNESEKAALSNEALLQSPSRGRCHGFAQSRVAATADSVDSPSGTPVWDATTMPQRCHNDAARGRALRATRRGS